MVVTKCESEYHPFTYFRQLCSSLNPSNSRIFLFENNGYGEGTGADYAVGSKDIASRAKGFGMPALKMDGTDLFDTYATCRKAVEHCRKGKGPIAIEAEA